MIKVRPCFFKNSLEGLLHFGIHAGGNGIKVFDHRHFGPQTGIDRAHFKSDHAGPNDHQFLRDLVKRQRAGGGDDGLLVNFDAGKGGGFRPGGDDDILCLMYLVAHLDLAGFGD